MARVEKASGKPADAGEIRARFEEEGLSPYDWSNGPDYRYGWHSHGYHKVLYCVSGGIVFHTHDGDLALDPGDRMEIEPQTEHGATVGPEGVMCMEAARRA